MNFLNLYMLALYVNLKLSSSFLPLALCFDFLDTNHCTMLKEPSLFF